MKDKPNKMELPVTFPMELDVTPYTAWGAGKGSGEATYVLSAVIVHKGGMDSGHYVSYAREGKEWFMFDDSKVVLVGEADVLAAQAYLLVYVMARV